LWPDDDEDDAGDAVVGADDMNGKTLASSLCLLFCFRCPGEGEEPEVEEDMALVRLELPEAEEDDDEEVDDVRDEVFIDDGEGL